MTLRLTLSLAAALALAPAVAREPPMNHAHLGTPGQATEARLPATPAGREFEAWLAAFNSQDLRTYEDYIRRRSPALHKYVQNDVDFALLTGGFTVIRAQERGPYVVEGLVSEPFADFPTRFSIRLDTEPPHHVLALDLGPAERPEDMPLPVLDEQALVHALTERLESQSRHGRFSGVVLLARGDRVLFERAYGMADAESNRVNTVDTRFPVASMGKMFTAVSVMQLAAEGRLDLQAPLAKAIPDYPNAAVARAVTLHQLLTHTAGTGDIFVPEIESQANQFREGADFIPVLAPRALEFTPGSRWSYSNYGYVLLGEAVQRASGEPYLDYVREHVYVPAGMRDSGASPGPGGASPVAKGYGRSPAGAAWLPVKPGLATMPTAAGGDLSTARDLYRFARALQDGRLLSAPDVETLTRGKVDAPFGAYAYGFKDQRRGGLRYYGHGGGAPGSNGELDIYPDSGYIVVVLTNQDPPFGNRVADFIGNRLAAADASGL